MTLDRDQFAQPSIFQKARAPEALNITIGPALLDLSLVTSVRLRVRIPGNPQDILWTTAIVTQRRDVLVVRHTFDVQGNETAIAVRYRIIPELVYHTEPVPPVTTPIPDGIRRCSPFYLGVMQ